MDLMKERTKFKINGNMDAYKHLNKVSKQVEMAKKNMYQSKIEEVSQTLNLFGKYLRSLGQIVKKM